MVEMLAEHGGTRDAWQRGMSCLDRAAGIRDDILDRERLGREMYLRGFLSFRLELIAAAACFGFGHPPGEVRMLTGSSPLRHA